jgi:hypothetical protein
MPYQFWILDFRFWIEQLVLRDSFGVAICSRLNRKRYNLTSHNLFRIAIVKTIGLAPVTTKKFPPQLIIDPLRE